MLANLLQIDWTDLESYGPIAVLLLILTILGGIIDAATNGKRILKRLWQWVLWLFAPLAVTKRVSKLELKVDSYAAETNEKLDKVLTEVRSNGGDSMKDVLNALLLRSYTDSAAWKLALSASGFAFWLSDKDGACTFASDKLAEIVGLNPDEVLGNGWVTNLIDADKARVFREWEYSVEQRRRFVMNYSFRHSDGRLVKVQGLSYPIILEDEVEGFVGLLTEIKGD